MSSGARAEPKPCSCRFCADQFTSAGIKNHETWCDENPNSGVHPDDAPALFDGAAAQESDFGSEQSDPDPDQSAEGASLPDRNVLSGRNKSDPKAPQKCPHCSSRHTVESEQALDEVRDRVPDPDPAILQLLESAEKYCNECFACYGGELEHSTLLSEVSA